MAGDNPEEVERDINEVIPRINRKAQCDIFHLAIFISGLIHKKQGKDNEFVAGMMNVLDTTEREGCWDKNYAYFNAGEWLARHQINAGQRYDATKTLWRIIE